MARRQRPPLDRVGAAPISPAPANLEKAGCACINRILPDPAPGHSSQPRSATLVAAGLLLAALALVVLYTGRGAFLSPLALVVIAAIGVAALLLQVRLRPDLPAGLRTSSRRPLWINGLGVVFALAAVFTDLLRLSANLMLFSALAAVVCFAVSGIVVLNAIRKTRA